MTTKTFFQAMLCSILLGASGVAYGQASPQEASEAAPRWAPVQVMEFGDDTVEGGVSSPDGLLVTAHTRAKHAGLIEIRQDFADEIVKTLEDL